MAPGSIGFTRGRGHPCVFWYAKKQIKPLVHGDDYVSSGTIDAVSCLEAELEKAYEIKTQKLGLAWPKDTRRKEKCSKD